MLSSSQRLINAMFAVFRTATPGDLAKAADDLADLADVDGGARYDPNFREGLRKLPTEHGKPLPMSGDGPQEAHEAYSMSASQAQELVRAYDAVGTLLSQQNARLDKMEKAVGFILADKAKMQKSPDWESTEAKNETKKDEDEPSESDVEKAVAAVKAGNASVSQVMTYLTHGQRDPVRTPPDMSGRTGAIRKATETVEDPCAGMSIEDAVTEMTRRQRQAWLDAHPGYDGPRS